MVKVTIEVEANTRENMAEALIWLSTQIEGEAEATQRNTSYMGRSDIRLRTVGEYDNG